MSLQIDAHVHIVGNGSSGSGCWLRVRHPYHRFLARLMLRELGLGPEDLSGKLDELYIDRLLTFVQNSSLQKIVILAHENVYDEGGRIIENFGSFYVPNDYVLTLGERYPQFLPAVSIHPARHDALEELARCVDRGATMMKCLPNCQNINCNDEKYRPFWTTMAKANLPLLAHTGGELSVPVYNKCYADPRTLMLPLECGVTVIAAHCGTSSHPFERNYLNEFRDMLIRYPNLYGDNSGMQTPWRVKHFRQLLEEPIRSRLIHGSDLPIPISPRWAKMWGLISKCAYEEATQESNPLERDRIIKRAAGFPEECFIRAAQFLRLK